MEFVLEEFHRNTPDEELIEDVKRVAALCQKESLTGKEYEAQGWFSLGTLRNRFGSWNEVLRHAGLSVERGRFKKHCYCEKDEDFFEDLRKVAKQFNRNYVSVEEYAQYGKYSYGQRRKRFKCWDNLLKAAGLEPTPFRTGPNLKYSDEELFEEMERMWILKGRQPRYYDEGFRINGKTYASRFGSWRKALEAFVSYINSDDDEEEKNESVPSEVVIDTSNDKKPTFKHKTKRDINLRLRFKVMARDHFKCCKCGKSPATDPSVILHIDHIHPYSKGGETIMENLQTLCSDCNLGKSDLIFE
jgi:hypothetical protein